VTVPFRSRVLALGLLVATTAQPWSARAAMPVPQRNVLEGYLTALSRREYARAFALLTDDERRYFATVANFASIYRADGIGLERFRILGSRAGTGGRLAIVSERVRFFDPAHDQSRTLTTNVEYGILTTPHGAKIKDPYHPWRAFVPVDARAGASGYTIAVRKISFFTGRVQILATFANAGSAAVTLLPYLRTTLRDDAGKTYAPVETKLPGLTDRTLFAGLRLPASGRYTGAMTFFTPDRFTPKTLKLTFAPALVDGADAPFEIALPDIAVPGA
jgi:hypothetical protein